MTCTSNLDFINSTANTHPLLSFFCTESCNYFFPGILEFRNPVHSHSLSSRQMTLFAFQLPIVNTTGGSDLILSGLQHILTATTLPGLDKQSLLANGNKQHLLHNTYNFSYFLYNLTLLQASSNPLKQITLHQHIL